jgi:hypothetical protein
MSGIDLDEVRAALTTRAVLDFYGWKARRSGSELESASCPTRGDHSRRAFVINANTGRWQCFPCATSGDLFDFIAQLDGLTLPADFRKALEKAAEIAGVGPSTLSDDERKQRAMAWAQKRESDENEERRIKADRDAAAVPTATGYWSELLTKDARGFDYLCERRVGDIVLQRDAVRFDPRHDGSPAVCLFTSRGEIRNVVARRLPALGEPKTPGLYACPSAGTLINHVSQIAEGSDVVLTEGVMDSITARLAWLDAIVLGAHGAGNLPKVASVAAPVIARAHGRMLLVPHNDDRGKSSALDACKIADRAGLRVSRGSIALVKHGHKDLNDAWRAGWRAA